MRAVAFHRGSRRRQLGLTKRVANPRPGAGRYGGEALYRRGQKWMTCLDGGGIVESIDGKSERKAVEEAAVKKPGMWKFGK